jgi:hypothetical protein
MGGSGAPPGVGPGVPGQPGVGTPPPEPDTGEYLYVYIEAEGVHGTGHYATFKRHAWGENGYLMGIPNFITFDYIPREPASREIEKKLKAIKDGKDSKDAKKSGNVADNLFRVAKDALRHGLLKPFQSAMNELARIDPNNDPAAKAYQPFVKNFLRVQQELKKAPAAEDPELKGLIKDLQDDGFRAVVSDQGHYVLWTKFVASATTDAMIKHKLARLEATLETFYYWFAMQEGAQQPPLPRTRLVAVMTDPAEYQNRQVSWGMHQPVADGFTPRRDNVLFLSSKRQDPLYTKLEANLRPQLDKLIQTFSLAQISKESLLTGKVWKDHKQKAAQMTGPIALGTSLLIVQKALEEDAERATITYEGTRQLLVASGMFPRHVDVPEWVLTGLASYFETPEMAVYPGVGLPSWSYLVSFRYFQNDIKGGKLANSAEVLYNVVTDRYFAKARIASDKAQDLHDEKLIDQAREEWDLARCTAWALVYHLVSNGKINNLVRYGKELNDLPRDLDLSEQALQASAARAFGLGEDKNAGKLDMNGRVKTRAVEWFAQMKDLTLELPGIENFHLKLRADLAQPKKTPPPSAAPGTGAPGFPPGIGGPGTGGTPPMGGSGAGYVPPGYGNPNKNN